MKRKKLNIKNFEEFRSALSISGLLLPIGKLEMEAGFSVISDQIDINEIASRIDAEEIWNSSFKRNYKVDKVTLSGNELSMAARSGFKEMDDEVLKQVLEKHGKSGNEYPEKEGD